MKLSKEKKAKLIPLIDRLIEKCGGPGSGVPGPCPGGGGGSGEGKPSKPGGKWRFLGKYDAKPKALSKEESLSLAKKAGLKVKEDGGHLVAEGSGVVVGKQLQKKGWKFEKSDNTTLYDKPNPRPGTIDSYSKDGIMASVTSGMGDSSSRLGFYSGYFAQD